LNIWDPQFNLTLPVTCSTTTTNPQKYRGATVRITAPWHSTVSLHRHIASSYGCLSSLHHNFHTHFLLHHSCLSVCPPISCICTFTRYSMFVCVCVPSVVYNNSNTANNVVLCFLQESLSQSLKKYRWCHRLIIETAR
jgi:hypothetical protein